MVEKRYREWRGVHIRKYAGASIVVNKTKRTHANGHWLRTCCLLKMVGFFVSHQSSPGQLCVVTVTANPFIRKVLGFFVCANRNIEI